MIRIIIAGLALGFVLYVGLLLAPIVLGVLAALWVPLAVGFVILCIMVWVEDSMYDPKNK